MDLSGQIRTTCRPEALIGILRDPVALAKILPAGAKLTTNDDGTMAFSVSKRVGPIRLTMPGTMSLTATGNKTDHLLTIHAAHLIGGKIDLSLTLAFNNGAGFTLLAYQGKITAAGLSARLLHKHEEQANRALKNLMIRLKDLGERQVRRKYNTVTTA